MKTFRGNVGKGQHGVVLFIALISLVAMSLAAIALVRSVDTGTMVAGNLGFKQSVVLSGDYGVEEARVWLIANKGALTADQSGAGYYASRQASLDLTGGLTADKVDDVNWDGTNTAALIVAKAMTFGGDGKDPAGNKVSYVMHRMCEITGSINAPAQSCASATITSSGSTKDAPRYDLYGLLEKQIIYYRVTVQISGPRNTQTFIQSWLII